MRDTVLFPGPSQMKSPVKVMLRPDRQRHLAWGIYQCIHHSITFRLIHVRERSSRQTFEWVKAAVGTIWFHAEFWRVNLQWLESSWWTDLRHTSCQHIENEIFESIWLDVFNFSISATWLLHSGWVWAWLKELDLMAPNITHAQRMSLLASHRLTLGTPSREIRILWDNVYCCGRLNIWQNEPAA